MLCGNFGRSMDKHGRVTIPRKLRNGFGKETMVVTGCGDHIEIWTSKQWASERLKTKKTLDKTRQ